MRLTRKFTLAMSLIIFAVLLANAARVLSREVALFEAGMKKHAHTLGRSLGHAVAFTWETRGEKDALALIAYSSEQYSDLDMRWVWIDGAATGNHEPRLDAGALEALRHGREVARRVSEPSGPGALYTYFPVTLQDGRIGALEIAESFKSQLEVIDTIWQHVLGSALVLTVTLALSISLLGSIFVGRPTRALVQKARRIGAGDLSGPLVLRQRDELREIADEVNTMCELLTASREAVAAETSARLKTMDQLRHADRLMTVGKLAAGVAHELGTPLSVVSGRAQMIATGETRPEAVAESARIIVSQSKRMADIIRQLLAFARPRRARVARVDVDEIARQTIELLLPMANKRKVTVVLAPSSSASVANADEGQVQQVLTNLVVNALHATPAGGTVTVELREELAHPPLEHTGSSGAYVNLSVTDTGIGMDEDTVSHIFEPFFTTKEVGEGTGLGLSVTHGIVKDHGGWIEVRSQPGHGSTFSVYLPTPDHEVRA